MSLDLDAQVLITECAPIASLIQRMGRCNRDSEKMRARPPGRVYVIRPTPGKEKPYEKEELKAAERFVSELAGKLVSQDRLEEAYRLCDPLKVETDKHTPFLDSGPFADGTEATFREGDEFTVPCVLDRDLDAVKQAIERREPIDAYTVPVPRRFARPLPPDYSRLPRWLSVASSDYYDRMTGFGDQARGDRSGGDL
jgi:CRISPR-associated endonuclease/helicase Cas3